MARPVTRFTGQWADLPLDELAAKVAEWDYDGEWGARDALECVRPTGFAASAIASDTQFR